MSSRVNLSGVGSTARLFTFFFALLSLASQFSTAAAADAGDVIAALLGTFLSLVIICAFLGWYSRRQGGGSSSSSSSDS